MRLCAVGKPPGHTGFPQPCPWNDAGEASKLERELRSVDADTIVGTWTAEISPLYARFVSAFPGLFHRDGDKRSRRYTMRYALTRA